jgi:hypothetical protein
VVFFSDPKGVKPRTSIFPVTAAVIREERYSLRRSMKVRDSEMRVSMREVSESRKEAMASCSDKAGIGILLEAT